MIETLAQLAVLADLSIDWEPLPELVEYCTELYYRVPYESFVDGSVHPGFPMGFMRFTR